MRDKQRIGEISTISHSSLTAQTESLLAVCLELIIYIVPIRTKIK